MSGTDETTTEIPPDAPEDEAVFGALAGGELGDDSWPTRPRKSGLSMRAPTAVLIALVIAAGAFWIGSYVQKSDGASSSTANLTGVASRLRSLFGGSGAGGAASFFGRGGATAAAPAASGILTAVEGDTLYLTNSSGNLVKVKLSPSTTITRETTATPKTLQIGDNVSVQGATGASGVITASSVSASAKSVPTTTTVSAGFPGAGAGSPAASGNGG